MHHNVEGKTLTKSLAWSFAVDFSRFSKSSSSLNVGLNGFVRPRPGVPGAFMALLRGDLGVMGIATDSRPAPLPIYPNPTSPG